MLLHAKGFQCSCAADAVSSQTVGLLELLHCLYGGAAVDAIHGSVVVAPAAQLVLNGGDSAARGALPIGGGVGRLNTGSGYHQNG